MKQAMMFETEIKIPEKKVKEKNVAFIKCTELWFTLYEKITGLKPSFTPKEAKNLKLLIGQIEKLNSDRSGVVDIFETILNSWKKLPAWYHANLSIAIINSKLNEILNCLKNGISDYRKPVAVITHQGANEAFNKFYSNR